MGHRITPALLVLAALLSLTPPARAQDEPVERTVNVGYIDSAIPRNTLRFRFDAAYDDQFPSRAEFFYPKGGGPGRPGPPLVDVRVNYQEYTPYLEWAFAPQLSGFIEGGVRAINPVFNNNEAGFGDMNLGVKWAFLMEEDRVVTFQLRTYVPTGNAHLGLGTAHVSLEPALLVNQRLNDWLLLEGELRYWAPIGGTDFSGDVARYGLGLSYAERERSGLWASPVAELVGWTVLSGKQTNASSPTSFVVEDAAGTSILNIKVGLRVGLDNMGDLYMGYGRALTDSAWYRDIVRVELRWFF